jgi:hypothetical protein
VHHDPSLAEALLQWLEPSNLHDIKSFMGGIDFYSKFVSHFSKLTRPLHQFSHEAKYVWTTEAE